jgi:hypothetical protein
MTMKAIHNRHQEALGINPFVEKNHKEALNKLDEAGRIFTSRPERRPGTFADDILVTVPRLEKK